MTLANGVHYLAIPGPSVVPERVQRALMRAGANIYAGELVDIAQGLDVDLRALAGTDHKMAMYIGNGHAAWEAALANTCAPGERVLLLVNGIFGKFWGDLAEGLGLQIDILAFDDDQPADPARIEAALRADTAGQIRAVLAVHVETSSGLRNDLAAISGAIQAAAHPALLIVDAIASMGCDPLKMAEWGVDVTLSACQKGLMTPPGMSFVWYGPRADARRAQMARVSHHWDWQPRTGIAHLGVGFNGTAPTHHLYALREAVTMIQDEGLEAVWQRHATLARAVWAAGEAWAQEGPLRIAVAEPKSRAHAVTAFHLPGYADALQNWCRDQVGLTLGFGLGRTPQEDYFRLGHMGHVNGQMVMGSLGGIQAGLCALGVPHGRGALEAAAAVIAQG